MRRSIGGGFKGKGWRETPSNQVKLNDMYVLYKKYAKNQLLM